MKPETLAVFGSKWGHMWEMGAKLYRDIYYLLKESGYA